MFGKLLNKFNSNKTAESSIPAVEIPPQDANIGAWLGFIEKADWETIRKAYQDFVASHAICTGEENQIMTILRQRLLEIELPVLSPEFIKKQKSIFIVDNDMPAQDIKSFVHTFHTHLLPPKYIVEASGQFRGFALSEDLVLLGVSSIVSTPSELIEQAQRQNIQLLNNVDSRCVDAYWQELIKLMEDINVPSLRSWEFWYTKDKDCAENYYISWSDLPKNAIELTGKSVLLAKL